MPRVMTIEKALRWAYCDELPKGTADDRPGGRGLQRPLVSSAGLMEGVSLLGVVVDNAYGVAQDMAASEDPHPDAVAIWEAVQRLDLLVPTAGVIDEDWIRGHGVDMGDHLASVMQSVADAVALDFGVTAAMPLLMQRIAYIGWGDVEIDAPEERTQTWDNGRPRWFRRVSAVDAAGLAYEVELDGWDAKARRPYPDAYRKCYLDPSPVDGLIARARAEVWRLALDVLVEDEALMAALTETVIQPSALPYRPWEAERGAVLADLSRSARPAIRNVRSKALVQNAGSA